MNRYSYNLELIFYNMGNNFMHLSNGRLTFKDLSELYNEDFHGNYIFIVNMT